jgi:hypothetical protein
MCVLYTLRSGKPSPISIARRPGNLKSPLRELEVEPSTELQSFDLSPEKFQRHFVSWTAQHHPRYDLHDYRSISV